jgi:MOSC domain-containing protein YiiM
MAVVRSVNVGSVVPAPWISHGRTAIDKRPVAGSVRAGELGLAGDAQANRRWHGGVDQAVYAYAREDLDFFAADLGRELRDGIFGENLTTSGLDLSGVVIGERWRVGTVGFEVSVPRIPCLTFERFLDEPGWIKRFTAAVRPGLYLRVREDGEVTAGDEILRLGAPAHGITVAEVFLAMTTERKRLPRMLDAPELPAEVHERAHAYLASRKGG